MLCEPMVTAVRVNDFGWGHRWNNATRAVQWIWFTQPDPRQGMKPFLESDFGMSLPIKILKNGGTFDYVGIYGRQPHFGRHYNFDSLETVYSDDCSKQYTDFRIVDFGAVCEFESNQFIGPMHFGDHKATLKWTMKPANKRKTHFDPMLGNGCTPQPMLWLRLLAMTMKRPGTLLESNMFSRRRDVFSGN